jgi:hypothetical protein
MRIIVAVMVMALALAHLLGAAAEIELASRRAAERALGLSQ